MNVNFSVIGDYMIIEGDIAEEQRLLINGIVNGNIESEHDVIVDGQVNGCIKARNLYINHGYVDGEVDAEKIYCDDIDNSISGVYQGEILPYKKFDKWEEESDLFDDLQKFVECDLVSDLKYEVSLIKAKEFLVRCDEKKYSYRNWVDLHRYLVGNVHDEHTIHDVCQSIISHL